MSDSPIEAALARRLGVELSRLRHDRGLTQEKVADSIGISANHLQLIESGLSDRRKKTPANPRLSTLLRLSEALEVELPELLARVLEGTDTA